MLLLLASIASVVDGKRSELLANVANVVVSSVVVGKRSERRVLLLCC